MVGTVKTLSNKYYGFIRATDGKEYFFHKSDYMGNWDELMEDYKIPRTIIEMEFDIVSSPKGPRAANVRR